jgi:outer membrane protein OmpA-like peptidoglycan-associated protein
MAKKKSKTEWEKAVSLGPIVNDEYDQIGLFMHPDGKTLYFSSNGYKVMGGLDIFKTVYNDSIKRWSKPENLGYPINTPDDDAFFSVSADGLHGYYSSMNRGGSGSHDLYMVTFKTTPNQLTLLKGVIMDKKTLKPIEAKIEITDNETGQVIAEFTSNSATGKYLVTLPSGKNYGIAVKADGYLFHSENIDIRATKVYTEIEKDIKLKKIEIGEKIVLRNIFFDLDKATLRPESVAELERLRKLMAENPKIKIEISGHTDNQGSAAHNKPLSMNRAKAVVDYLILHEIDAERMRFAGYGFERPMATNKTEEGRQLNRRTEFEIISSN